MNYEKLAEIAPKPPYRITKNLYLGDANRKFLESEKERLQKKGWKLKIVKITVRNNAINFRKYAYLKRIE